MKRLQRLQKQFKYLKMGVVAVAMRSIPSVHRKRLLHCGCVVVAYNSVCLWESLGEPCALFDGRSI